VGLNVGKSLSLFFPVAQFVNLKPFFTEISKTTLGLQVPVFIEVYTLLQLKISNQKYREKYIYIKRHVIGCV
jgi:hypothetical protein